MSFNDSFLNPSFFIKSYEDKKILSPAYFFKWKGLVEIIKKYHKSWYFFNNFFKNSMKHIWLFLIIENIFINSCKSELLTSSNSIFPFVKSKFNKFSLKVKSAKQKILQSASTSLVEKYNTKFRYWWQRVKVKFSPICV